MIRPPANRLRSATAPYDNNLRIETLSVQSADNSHTSTYDNDGLMTAAVTGTHTFSLQRRADNGFLSGTVAGGVTTTLEYTPFGEIASESAAFADVPLYSVAHTYDKLSRIITKTETVQDVTIVYEYGYDLAGRLETVSENGLLVEQYGYDANGNRTLLNGQAAGTYDAQDRLTAYGGNTYTYTANGELHTKTVAGQTTVYHYDVFNNLTKVEQPDGTVIEYVIDPADRRAGKKVDGTLVKGWLYHGPVNPVAETDAAGNITAYFVYATQDHVPDYLVTADAVYRYLTDQNGSVRLVVNTVTGEVAQRLDYDAWGKVLYDSNPGFQPFGFAGGHYDPDTGLVRFGGRDYDPETGRWTSQDPIGHSGGDSNLYAYVYNDPVNEIDPSGYFLPMLAGCLIRGALETAAEAAIMGNMGCMDAGDWVMGALSGCNPFKWLNKARKIAKAASKCANSFPAGTQVHTENGIKPIEDIKTGDMVLSYNEKTGTTEYQPVTGLIQNEKQYRLLKVTLNSGEVIETTEGHPFYIKGKGWYAAAHLKVGDVLLLHNGQTVVVSEVDTSVRMETVYNFSVANTANYFVGEDGVLVHNCWPSGALSGKDIVRFLKRKGWTVKRQNGTSHVIMESPDGTKTIPVPVHGNKSLGKGLREAIKKQAGY